MLAEGDTAEDVGGEELLSLWLLERLLPGGGGELEDAGARPGGQQAQEVAEVAEGLDAVHLAAGQQGHEERVGAGAVVAADEEPVLATDRLAPQRALRDVVVEGQTAVVQEAPQRGLLVGSIRQGRGDRRAVESDLGLSGAPREEV